MRKTYSKVGINLANDVFRVRQIPIHKKAINRCCGAAMMGLNPALKANKNAEDGSSSQLRIRHYHSLDQIKRRWRHFHVTNRHVRGTCQHLWLKSSQPWFHSEYATNVASTNLG
jgi:hypothetical protein